jgi:hypothetical protein
VLNGDGTPDPEGHYRWRGDFAHVQRTIPLPAPLPGGNTQLISNFEYRIPIVGPVRSPVSLMPAKRLSCEAAHPEPDRVTDLNSKFPQAGFSGDDHRARPAHRSSGLELRVMMPVVFRLYWAYNPQIISPRLLQPPVAGSVALPELCAPSASWAAGQPLFERIPYGSPSAARSDAMAFLCMLLSKIASGICEQDTFLSSIRCAWSYGWPARPAAQPGKVGIIDMRRAGRHAGGQKVRRTQTRYRQAGTERQSEIALCRTSAAVAATP